MKVLSLVFLKCKKADFSLLMSRCVSPSKIVQHASNLVAIQMSLKTIFWVVHVDHSFHVSLSPILHGEVLRDGSSGWPPLVIVQGGSRRILHLAVLHATKAFVNVFNTQLRHAIRGSADGVA